MPGAYNYEWFRQQDEGIRLLAARSAQRANREGYPNRDSERRVRRRARRRALRDIRQTQGLRAWLGALFGKTEF